MFRHGVTYWNYVGEPVHYVLAAIERAYDGDETRIAAIAVRGSTPATTKCVLKVVRIA